MVELQHGGVFAVEFLGWDTHIRIDEVLVTVREWEWAIGTERLTA